MDRLKDVIEHESRLLKMRLAGLAHLLENFDAVGTREDDNEAMDGLGYIVRDLSTRAGEISDLGGLASSVGADAELEIDADTPRCYALRAHLEVARRLHEEAKVTKISQKKGVLAR